jgi:hypothetical protein
LAALAFNSSERFLCLLAVCSSCVEITIEPFYHLSYCLVFGVHFCHARFSLLRYRKGCSEVLLKITLLQALETGLKAPSRIVSTSIDTL